MGISWLFGEHHVTTLGELDLLLRSAAIWLFLAGFIWVLYIALEPFVRRHLPGWLVGWSRVLAGSFRDPMVGRDLMVGCVIGVVLLLLNYLRFPLAFLFGAPQIKPSAVFMALIELAGFQRTGNLYLLSGAHSLIVCASNMLVGCAAIGLAFSVWVFVFRVLLRRTWAAVVAVMLWGTAANALGSEASLFSLIPLVLAIGIIMFVLFRFGLLAFITSALFYCLSLALPLTAQLSAWYAGIGITGLALLLAMALYAFRTSLGGRPLLAPSRLDE